MNRPAMWRKSRTAGNGWELIVIGGGGATGLGIAIDAAHRGYRTLLLEQSDFAKGTSSGARSWCTGASGICNKATCRWCLKH